MGRVRGKSLKGAFFWYTLWCVLGGAALSAAAFAACVGLRGALNPGGALLVVDGVTQSVPAPPVTPGAAALAGALEVLQFLLPLALMVGALALADVLFYRRRLKAPIAALEQGARRIMENDLDFAMPALGEDELGRLCAAFESMRVQLEENNRALWRQLEERKRLNAAFSHDLRNPITVLKGTVQMMRRQGGEQAAGLERLEQYTERIEAYVEAMSSAGRLEALPVRRRETTFGAVRLALWESAQVLAPGCACAAAGEEGAPLRVDLGLLLQVAENLLANAARFARGRVALTLALEGDTLALRVEDDGPGYPEELLRRGPQPFQRGGEDAAHFGMGLYLCALLCEKQGGALALSNHPGAAARVRLPAKP